jgi:hypothetical protein
MATVVCPHCKTQRIATGRVPRDVVVVMPCPACHELSILFRSRVIPVSRRIIEKGSKKERIEHLANIIEAFLDAGILPFDGEDASKGFAERPRPRRPRRQPVEEEEGSAPITDQEFDQFVKIDLDALDDPAYFRKYFN